MKQIPLDKQLHFLGSGLLVTVFYILGIPLIFSVGLSLIIGLLKEVVWDYFLKKGTPDVMDAVFNMAGILLVGLFIAIKEMF